MNLSRALSDSVERPPSSGYRTISMGRVQGPTLAFVVRRSRDPEPSCLPLTGMSLVSSRRREGVSRLPSSRAKFLSRTDAESIKSACEGKMGWFLRSPRASTRSLRRLLSTRATCRGRRTGSSDTRRPRPCKSPSDCTLMRLISYPRTGQPETPAVDRVQGDSVQAGRESLSMLILRGTCSKVVFLPEKGREMDRAHPAIYPTGAPSKKAVCGERERMFDIIVRRFLACFGEDAVRERVNLRI